MTIVNSHVPGSFCWIELATNDVSASRSFYTQLFSWTVNEIPMGEGNFYYIFQKDGRDCAAMYRMDAQMQGVPPNWMSYVAVTDADAAAEKAKSLGATVHAGPFDVYDSGRMAALADPFGGSFSIWQAKNHIGVQVRDEPNTLCWNELHAHDLEGSKNFYTALFGWRAKESPEYTEWHLGEQAIGGMLRSHAPAQVPPLWVPYFAVTDADATVAAARSARAQVFVEPQDIPNVGRFAVLGDPQGAMFCVIKLTM